MADELVTIKIEVNADTRAIDKVKRKLRELRAESKLLNGDVSRAGRSLDDMSSSSDRLGDSADRTDGKLKRMGRNLTQALIPNVDKAKKRFQEFFEFLNKAIKFGLKVFGIQVVALGIGLAAVSAAFKVGSFAAKGWQFALTAAAGAAGAVAAGLATAAAAMRQYQSAMNAVNYTKGPLGSRQAMTASGMRSMQMDPALGSFGPKAIQGGFAALSKNARYTGDMSGSFKALGDFAVASGDMDKGLAAAGAFLGLLRKNGKVTEEAAAAAADLGTEFETALENAMKLGTLDEGSFLAALKSGKLNDKVSGLLDGVDKTLVGQLKKYANQLLVLAADTGQAFLPSVQEGFDTMFKSLNVALKRVAATLRGFDSGGLLDGITGAFDRIVTKAADLFDKYLPKAEGLFSRMGGWVDKARDGFRKFVDILRPLKEGGQVIIDTFKPIVGGFFGGLGNSMQVLNDVLVNNRADFVGFGEAIARIFDQSTRLFNGMKAVLGDIMPALRMIAEAIANIAEQVMNVIEPVAGFLSSGGGGGKAGSENKFGSMATLLGLVGGYMGIRKLGEEGKFGKAPNRSPNRSRLDNVLNRPDAVSSAVATMNVNAGVVNIMQGGTRFAPGQGGGLTPPPFTGQAPNQKGWGTPPPFSGQAPDQRKWKPGGGMFSKLNARKMGSMAQSALPYAMMAATPFASEQAQPWMMAGGTVGMLTANPMLGAAVGGVGAATTAQTPAGGALAGALGGAAIGTLIAPGIGTAIGAAAGLLVGALLGWAGAARAAEAASNSVAEGAKNGIDSGLYRGVMENRDPTQLQQGLDDSQRRWEALTEIANELRDSNGKWDSGLGNDVPAAFDTAEERQAIFDRLGRDPEKVKDGDPFEVEQALKFEGRQDFRDRRDRAIDDLVSSGNLTEDQARDLRNKVLNVNGTNVGSYDKAVEAANKGAEDASRSLEKMTGIYEFNVDRLSKASGMTADEVVKLAGEMGVNLYDASMTATDGLAKLGIQLPKTMDEMNAAMRKSALEGIDKLFSETFDAEKGQEAINQAAEDLRNTKGALSDEQKRDFSRLVSEQAFALFPDDAFKAMQFYQENMTDPNSPQFTNPTSPLYGRRDEFLNDPQIQQYNTGLKKVFRDSQEEQARGAIMQSLEAGTGGARTADLDALNTWISKASDAQLEWAAKGGMAQLEATNTEGSEAATTAEKSKTDALTAAATAQALMNALGITGVESTTDVTGQDATDDIKLSDEAQKWFDATQQGVKEGFAQKPSWYTQAPGWYNKPITVTLNGPGAGGATVTPPSGGGTTTPPNNSILGPLLDPDGNGIPGTQDTATSRLAATMAKHNRLNSMIAGKRSVISSLRDTGLGSLNSDHLTGNAYDLTGQNLGAYQQLVQDNGGFAEFHNDGGRHLHVVPGTSADMPAGDTATPMVGAVSEPVYVGNGDTFNLTVVGGPNSSPQAIAREVEAIINKKTRSRKERR